MNKNNGFTLTELIVAIMIISILSVTFSSLILSNKNASENISEKMFANNICENSVVIFRSSAVKSDDIKQLYANFRSGVEKILSVNLPDTLNDNIVNIYFDEEFNQITSGNNSKFTCSYSFSKSEKPQTIIFNVAVNCERELMQLQYTLDLKESI